MKKLAISIFAGVAMFSGIACGGSSWSDADKHQLDQQLTVAKAFGVLTDDQAECFSDWIQDRYDSLAKAMVDETNSIAKKDLIKTCKIGGALLMEDDYS